MKTYTTVLGDTWDMIAFKIYGKEKYAKELVESNINYVETVIFSAGTVINIPEITETVDTSSMPPWKR
ncbi:tail protein X [Clostridium chromiireducens]|uniref:Phage tail protein X n=1 Tax=Clostridium chromiireducens TaxID=225345 RepID=A0A1V4IUI0_9CLOT|nr:tail protein X [Clostridium chromiireducens]OPJ63682.1 phage tail protein X [Clostridium chromiireducens]